MALKTILDQDAKGIKNIQKHVHAFLVWWFSQATLWAKCQWFNVGNCGQWETTHGSGHRVNWCYFLFTKVVYGVQNRKTRRKFYFFVVSKSSQFRWENTLVSISGGSGIRPSCSSCLIKPKSNGYKRNVVNTSIELQLFEVINSYYFLCNLFSSFVCICRFGGSCNQKVRYGKIQKQQDSCKFEWQVYYFWLCCSPQVLSPWWLEKWLRKGQCGPPPGHRRVQSRLGFFWNQHLRNPWNEKAYVYSHTKWDTFWYFELWLDDGCG